VSVDALYANKQLLTTYNRRIPKTWDELIETSKYILHEERKKNNTDLVAYNGLMNGNINVYIFENICIYMLYFKLYNIRLFSFV